jgi:hypothetical protein
VELRRGVFSVTSPIEKVDESFSIDSFVKNVSFTVLSNERTSVWGCYQQSAC